MIQIKLDENLDPRLGDLLTAAGFDVDTVKSEGLCGASDDLIYATCKQIKRVPITLDLDFSNPFRFPPGSTSGIVVVRPPRPTLPAIRATLLSALPQLKELLVEGALLIVEPNRIRVHSPDNPESD